MEISTLRNKTFFSASPATSVPVPIRGLGSVPVPQAGGLVAQEGVSSAVPGPAGSRSAMLDIPTPQSGQVVKRGLTRVSRRLFSRAILGLAIPGRYYFFTWTSSPQSPPIEKSWRALRKWLKRQRPGACWCYVITDEGHGVIHMIIRLGKNEKRLDVRDVRAHWQRLHRATQIRAEYVKEPLSLAAYFADQRHKRKLSGELAWQDGIVRWRWSKGWLPKGFTRAFGRTFVRLLDLPSLVRELTIKTWLLRCHGDPAQLLHPPRIEKLTRCNPDQVRS
jgi:hypothetical protein